MDEAARALVRDWLIRASHDLQAARTLASGKEPLLDTAIYHCQQAAEKAVKLRFRVESAPDGSAAMKREPTNTMTEKAGSDLVLQEIWRIKAKLSAACGDDVHRLFATSSSGTFRPSGRESSETEGQVPLAVTMMNSGASSDSGGPACQPERKESQRTATRHGIYMASHAPAARIFEMLGQEVLEIR